VSWDRSLTILVHSMTKVGKSTFSVTSPYPRLYLDVEQASKFLPINATFWDPNHPPPVADGTWDTCVVPTTEWGTVERVHQWLRSGKHQFKSLIIDSISELQVKCLDSISPGRAAVQTQQWGELLRMMAGFCRDVRDLTAHATNPLDAVVITAMTRNIEGIWSPQLQGQLAAQIPYWYDIVGYMYVDSVMDEAGQSHEVRRMLTHKHPQYVTGERVQGRLPGVIDNPNVESMLSQIFDQRGTPALTLPPEEVQQDAVLIDPTSTPA